jgi:hypothetical protein
MIVPARGLPRKTKVAQNLFESRFCIRRNDGHMSGLWKFWITKAGDVYLAGRSMGGIEKYSFHVSGICRHAFTSEHGIPATMTDRAMSKWRRAAIPPNGVSRVAWMAFPTDHLLPGPKEHPSKTHIFPAAPRGMATYVDLGFVTDSETVVHESFAVRKERNLVHYVSLPNGEAFILYWYFAEWNEHVRTLTGEKQDIVFGGDSEDWIGPFVRVCFSPTPKDGDAIQISEQGGYAVARA